MTPIGICSKCGMCFEAKETQEEYLQTMKLHCKKHPETELIRQGIFEVRL